MSLSVLEQTSASLCHYCSDLAECCSVSTPYYKHSSLKWIQRKITDFDIERGKLSNSFSMVCIAKKTNLQVKDDKTRGLYVQDATEVYVQNPEEMFTVMRSG